MLEYPIHWFGQDLGTPIRPSGGMQVAVRLRLKRQGRKHRSFYRLSAIDGRMPRDGRVLEELGWYDPEGRDPQNQVKIELERVQYWLSVGAQPSETVKNLLKRHGLEVAKREAPAKTAE